MDKLPDTLILFCRPGFEADCGNELTDQAARRESFGYFRPGQVLGTVLFTLPGEGEAEVLLSTLPLDELVFVRDWFLLLAEVELPATDRVGAVIEGLKETVPLEKQPGRVEVRLGETNEDADLGRFARKWVAPLSKGLRGAGLLAKDPESEHPLQLEILLNGFERALVGVSAAGNRARHPSGILRLKFPGDAPSRSTLKLEEAWKVFLPPGRELEFLGGGRQAVDLGAAPGGWTWQLVNQGMKVIAVDNGPMDDSLMASGMVEHVRDDGYSWLPRRGVDWMVCDIVDKPRRTAELAARWVAGKHCRYTIFNLKLPMKKRYEEWLACRELIGERLATAEVPFRLTARHLYHDREEITCFLERLEN